MAIDLLKVNGVKPIPGWAPRLSQALTDILPFSEWTKYAIVTDNQHNLPACAGFATANWIECLLRKKHGRDILKSGEQIDGEAIWRKARQMFWSHEPVEDGGLFMDQGFRAAITLGILPPDTQVVMADMDLAQLATQLQSYPVLQGTMVSAGWNFPDQENGQVQEMDQNLGGHATCIIGVLRKDERHYILFQNSWGSDWGMGGYGLLTVRQWMKSLLGPLSTAIVSKSFMQWNGWRDFVVVK